MRREGNISLFINFVDEIWNLTSHIIVIFWFNEVAFLSVSTNTRNIGSRRIRINMRAS